MKITINHIAQVANVSKSTVSKVINDSPTISDATKNRIRQIMKELNYIPNSLATQLAKQSSKTIGLFMDISYESHFQDTFFYSIIGGVESLLVPKDYEIHIANISNIELTDFLRGYVYNQKYCGLILPMSKVDDDMLFELEKNKVPYVILGYKEEYKDKHCVDINNFAGGELLTVHLLNLGKKNIACMGNASSGGALSVQRHEGYLQALRNYKIPIREDYIYTAITDEADAYKASMSLLQNQKVEAIVCEDNYMSFGCLKAMKELGLSCPEDIALATFNNYPIAGYTDPPLTCAHMDTYHLGQRLGQLLLDQIQNPEIRIKHTLITPELIVRQSTVGEKE